MEIWRDIKGYEGKYQISNTGQVKSLNFNNTKTERLLTLNIGNHGYYRVTLANNGSYKQVNIHRLVAEAFIPNPNNFGCVNHKDEDRLNNNVNNLEWCTLEYNTVYGSLQSRAAKSRMKPVRCIETNKVYDSAKTAAAELQLNASAITQCCKGKRKTHSKLHWEYV